MRHVATKEQLRHVLIFSYSFLTVAAVWILIQRNYEFLLYLAVMSLIIVAVLGVYRRAGLSRALLWGFSLWGLAHMIGGLAPIPDTWHTADTTGVFYNWRIIPGYVKYDQLVHGCGVGLVTWLCWQALASRTRSRDGGPLQPTLGMLGICATGGMGFGALNEVIEFFATMIIPQNNIGDYQNTGWDLVANLIGAVITAILIRQVWHHQTKTHNQPT
ncbi:MAG: hypothetical protein CMO55_11935 [Verrucomicrobiales bacterium]|nr:hypothetical protein [Verrucomicrobiales bacterium]